MPVNLPSPPTAERLIERDTRHGIARSDEYAWLRAANWQDVFKDTSVLDPSIRIHLEAENAYAEEVMGDTKELREALIAEMRGRIKEDDSSVPAPDGDFSYGVAYEAGAEYPRFVRYRRGAETSSEPHILVDGPSEAADRSYFSMGGVTHSPDHTTLAWSYDDKGSEYYLLAIRDAESGANTGTVIQDTSGAAAWASNSRGFFYTRLDKNHRPSKVFYHALGSDPDEDRLIYEETDSGFFMGVGKSQSGRLVLIDIHDHETSECWMIPASNPAAEPRLIAERETGIEYDVDEGEDCLYIRTNADGARDFKIVTTPMDKPERSAWVDVVPHEEGRLIISHMALKRHLVWLERRDGLPRIVVKKFNSSPDPTDGPEHSIAFDEEAYSLGLIGTYEYDTDVIRFSYSSLTTAAQTFEYNVETRERTLLKTQEVPSGHNPQNYVARRIFAPAKDGELVPVSVVHHKDTPIDGSAPCLLYGYGSYGISIPASFSTNTLSLIDRGFVYAIAHIRGGKDKGFAWYEAGRRQNKANTFTDFIAAANHLVAENFTSEGRIVAHGGSAGGMLMGAVANMAPATFGAIVAVVPFVDVLNTMLDDTLPLTPPEWPEWGNPILSGEDYQVIAAYSPYDNVKAQAYPPILALAGLTDPRVTYWEPAKWVARLRAMKTDDNPVILRTNMDSGHGGASGRFTKLEEVAYIYAFALKMTGTI
ncbi:Esterase/lipase/thioesterase, active site:Prolyl oligopeptidase:Prolyl oligopeptidase serine protease [Fulvimarina pelagi HTCC2506]|uniref:Esterase/lipase/thioesterase, active site:Prolyl oligopeptidase:Prolyl oligopeptidase serine protease n=1 Tax=Fulvimarina pelagi HTCC2506 TaxID=314231 RepID=Q0G4T7_9HYPH|nr:S9 family peptidase [Fulvimarina pelagi]EAU43327.1 Esterase/lipase/thioesterase, active site:Prolyl oligopeptidase:Prolyl oligopeptidase serine protease [Fulvimarina pelagi HTCC2506]